MNLFMVGSLPGILKDFWRVFQIGGVLSDVSLTQNN